MVGVSVDASTVVDAVVNSCWPLSCVVGVSVEAGVLLVLGLVVMVDEIVVVLIETSRLNLDGNPSTDTMKQTKTHRI